MRPAAHTLAGAGQEGSGMPDMSAVEAQMVRTVRGCNRGFRRPCPPCARAWGADVAVSRLWGAESSERWAGSTRAVRAGTSSRELVLNASPSSCGRPSLDLVFRCPHLGLY